MIRQYPICLSLLLSMVIVTGCSSASVESGGPGQTENGRAFPGPEDGKNDVFGRALVGIAAPYTADPAIAENTAELQSNMRLRRQTAWDIVRRILEPVPLLGLAEMSAEGALEFEADTPMVPRWQTWYGVDDFKRMFRRLYSDIGGEGRRTMEPFSDSKIDAVFQWNAAAVDRSRRWPLERFFKHVNDLGHCSPGLTPAECARSVQSNFSGAASGNARITYSPATVKHLLKNYHTQLTCMDRLGGLPLNAVQDNEAENFALCLDGEFPDNAVLIKAQWARADFGRDIPVYDTDAVGLERVIGPSKTAHWADGDRRANPGPEKIYTIRTRTGDLYRLVGLHIMTKELRHWVWVTLWWSDLPDVDFGADRPASVSDDPVWSNYKMAVVVDFVENATDPGAGFDDFPTLQSALNVEGEGLSWASNPYIEHGRGNARTNCIGCHQHGGSTVAFDQNEDGALDPLNLEAIVENTALFPFNGRTQQRTVFPVDYLWSTQRMDNLRQVMLTEVQHFEVADERSLSARVDSVLSEFLDSGAGQSLFENHCTACHGESGTGTSNGPDLHERISSLSGTELVEVLLTGTDNMPSWAHFSDTELSSLVAYLADRFGTVGE